MYFKIKMIIWVCLCCSEKKRMGANRKVGGIKIITVNFLGDFRQMIDHISPFLKVAFIIKIADTMLDITVQDLGVPIYFLFL
jgi:hypothetical protein